MENTTNQLNGILRRVTKTMTKPNSNVLQALENFKMWIGWHPTDYKGATEFASDMLETAEEVDCFERELRSVVIDLHLAEVV